MSALNSWREEKRSAFLYNTLAQKETIPAHKLLFQELEASANKQAALWANELKKNNITVPAVYHPDLRTRLVASLTNQFGAKRMRFILSAMKVRGMSIFIGDAHPHEKLAPAVTTHEPRHKSISSGGNLRAAVFGVNDGLISNMSLLLGVAGAQANFHFILLSGIAGLLAGASSMAAGEYISVRSQREFFEYQIALEKSELEEYPEEEAQELAYIYEARGLSKEEAERLAKVLINNPDTALDTLAREELGLNPNELGSAKGAALSSFVSFAFGAFIPLIPFMLSNSTWNLIASAGLTAVTLFVIGALLSLFTNNNALKSGLRMLSIGVIAGVLTYLIGHLVGGHL